ncbi:MAG TPA: TonB family protein, partial [Gemmatimonadaceae bacterium]|nr:TonB family protein [Gemmatimonadaceae bacterium]
RLIGELPTPRIPADVADVEGVVRVHFNVDAQGRPVMSSLTVETSPNPLLTSAVRTVIPSIRFEPARSGGPESRPIGDVVQVAFQFSRRK